MIVNDFFCIFVTENLNQLGNDKAGKLIEQLINI